MLKLFSLIFTAILFSQFAIERASEVNVSVGEQSSIARTANSVPVLAKAENEQLSSNRNAKFVARRAERLLTSLPTITPELREALEVQKSLLKRQSPRKSFNVNGLHASATRKWVC